MDYSFLFDIVNLELSILYILGCLVIIFKKILYFLSEDHFYIKFNKQCRP